MAIYWAIPKVWHTFRKEDIGIKKTSSFIFYIFCHKGKEQIVIPQKMLTVLVQNKNGILKLLLLLSLLWLWLRFFKIIVIIIIITNFDTKKLEFSICWQLF